MKKYNIFCWIPFFGLFWLYYISDYGKFHPKYYVGLLYYPYQSIVTFLICLPFVW